MTEPGNELPPENDGGLQRAVRLLLLLSRVDFSDEQKRLISEELREFPAWKLFAGLAVRHGVAALVWQNISDLGLAGQVPETERTLLDGLRFKSIARVSWITGIAAAVTDLLDREGIKVVLLKGLALEHTVYGARGLRQMSDADILVAPSDALRARDILIAAGFESMPLKSPLYRHIILDLGNHLPELHRGGISVDLHYRLFGPEGEEMVERAIRDSIVIRGAGREAGVRQEVIREPGADPGPAREPAAGVASSRELAAAAASSLEPVINAGTRTGSDLPGSGSGTFRVPPPVTAFLALVSHIYKHEIKGEFQLRLWTDIYLLLERYGEQILTARLSAEAEEAGIREETTAVLAVMEHVWELAMPEGLTVHTAAEKATVSGFMHRLAHPGSVESLSQREMFVRNLKALKGRRKKFIFIIGDIFPSVGFMKRRYACRSNLSAILYYPHRLGKILWILGLIRTKNYDN